MINTDMKNREILLNETRKHIEREMKEYIKELKKLYFDFLSYNGLSEKYDIKFMDNDVRLCIPHSENIWGRVTLANQILTAKIDNPILVEMEETLKKNNKKIYKEEYKHKKS